MSFLDSISFFESFNYWIIFPIVAIPAIILGLTGKRISTYALAVSVVFIAFSFKTHELKEFCLFIICQWTLISIFFVADRIFRRWDMGLSAPHRIVFHFSIALSILPLLLSRLYGVGVTQTNIGFLGISYITFRVIQMIIEIYDGFIEDISFIEFISFMTFFPTLSSGPIDRSRRFHEDFVKRYERSEYAALCSSGIFMLIQGMIYKQIIGEYLYTNWTSYYSEDNTLVGLIIYMYAYGLYLFFDFAGYSLMAIGTSKIFGINTPINFNKPFIAKDIKDFWNRWHITLSHWFRDFIFNRFIVSALKSKRFSNKLNAGMSGYLMNMTIMGLWHGFSISYVLYGVYHGALLAVTDFYQKKSKFHKKNKSKRGYIALSTFITFNLVMFGFFIFSGRFVVALDWVVRQL